jgi:NADH-quinone oxidoreductase subunit M
MAAMTAIRAGKTAALLVAGAMLLAVAFGALPGSGPTATVLMLLVAVTAFVIILGQQPTRRAALCLATTLVMLALSLAALAAGQATRPLFLGANLGAVGLLVLWTRRSRRDGLAMGAAAAFAVALTSLAGSLAVSGSLASTLQLVAYASLLPLFPLQGGFIGALTRLPGTLPAFLAVALPCLGWYGLLGLVPDIPALLLRTVVVLALAGALYEALRASVQFHLARMIASIATILLSVAWWHLGVSHEAAPAAGWYVMTVSLAASGLLLAGHLLETRYGCADLDKLTGLARPMPRFATVVGLLLFVAMGLPLFGNFSAFLAVLFGAPSPLPRSAGMVLAFWLVASLLLMRLLQRLLCGQPRAALLYRDVGLGELLPLILMIGLLALSVQAPMTPPQPAALGPTTVIAAGSISR